MAKRTNTVPAHDGINSQPQGGTVIDMQKAVASGDQAKGAAVAETLIKYCTDQAGKLIRYLQDIANLSLAGRTGFRARVAEFNKQQREWIKTLPATQQKEAKRSHTISAVRLSEAKTFSDAVDRGYVPNWEHGYGRVIFQAREWNRANAAGSNRGRKTSSPIEKVQTYIKGLLDRGELKATDMPQVEEAIHIITLQVTPQKKGKKGTPPAADAQPTKRRSAGPTRRKDASIILPPGVNEERRTEENPVPPLGMERRTHVAPATQQ